MATRDPAVDDDPPAPGARGGTRDTRVDTYLADARPFARPILAHLRHVVHAACPEVEETIKWRMPFFVYRGDNLCHMAAFKAHCAFGFWRARELPGIPARSEENAMGSFGRITSVDDLPPKRVLTSLVKAAIKLDGALGERPRATARPPPPLPEDVAAALVARPEAAHAFDALSPSMRREYLEWIIDAKRAATRTTRIATTLDRIVGAPGTRKAKTC